MRSLNLWCFVGRWIVIALASTSALAMTARAQSDSIVIWTTAIQSGTLNERGVAMARLGTIPAVDLPSATVRVLLDELQRIHAAHDSGLRLALPGDPDDHGAYYIDLVTIIADLRSKEGALKLVPAIEVSGGVQRRVARYGFGDAVTPLRALIGKRRSIYDALETLGLVWFWSDSTAAQLTAAQRGGIVDALGAAAVGDADDQFGAIMALIAMRDPSWLAYAQWLRAQLAAGPADGVNVANRTRLDAEVLPALLSAAPRTNAALIASVERFFASVCAVSTTGRRRGVCESTPNQLSAARAHFGAGRYGPARNVYSSVADAIQRARTSADLTPSEYAILSGDLVLLLSRQW